MLMPGSRCAFLLAVAVVTWAATPASSWGQGSTGGVPSSAGPRARAAIVGGTKAKPGQFPWLAAVIDLNNASSGKEGLCSGTVVSSDVVLTAAHCVINVATGRRDPISHFRVLTGTVDLEHLSQLQVSTVSGVFVYPWYNNDTITGDAALLVLTTPTTAPAISLASRSDVRYMQPGTEVAIAGWGKLRPAATHLAPTLHWGLIVTQRPGYCRTYNGIDAVEFNRHRQFCAIDPHFVVSTCGGDSGGPAIVASTATTFLEVGIVSSGAHNCSARVPSVFTRIDLVSAWVDKIITEVRPP